MTAFSLYQKHPIPSRLAHPMRCSAIVLSAACCFLLGSIAGAAEVFADTAQSG